MKKLKNDAALIWDMLDAGHAAIGFVEGKTFLDYERDRLLRGAVERHIEIFGEAARSVSKELQAKYPQIPWKFIIGQRHVLAHDYGEIRHERIWEIMSIRLPAVLPQLQQIYDEFPSDPT